MSDNRARSIPCPFCKDGEFMKHNKGGLQSWVPIRGRGVQRHYLDPYRCKTCGIIVFKERSEK